MGTDRVWMKNRKGLIKVWKWTADDSRCAFQRKELASFLKLGFDP